ncbi:hypothetical protein [Iodobacter ciconiae]|uniref:hypothetical protein n=1 Tax=Iodobacter ciconiae TaxID=2496266 RepID=UPI0013DECAC0|nr:hypothetical protein [Iodobacter ciconiae]
MTKLVQLKTYARCRPVTAKALLRAVASSTAIETGQSIQQLENKLKQPSGKFASLKLAR